MTITEMIAALENIRNEYGDIRIDGVRKDEDDFWVGYEPVINVDVYRDSEYNREDRMMHDVYRVSIEH